MRRLKMNNGLFIAFALAGCLTAAPHLLAQEPAAGSSAGSKPADASQKPATAAPQPAAASHSSANPFPEDTSAVPVLPSKSAPALPEGSAAPPENAQEFSQAALPGEDQDPVRSPDDPEPAAASATELSFSSSTAGLDKLLPPPDDDQPGKKRKLFVKEPAHREAASKDIEVGTYYLQTRNWKAALSRFESAMVLDPENPEVYWGLAEAEHHRGKFAEAKAYYLKLLEYDPDGPHGRQARKELKDPSIAAAGEPAGGTPQ
jgi:tetratricopeptide (TPR) repeat protein